VLTLESFGRLGRPASSFRSTLALSLARMVMVIVMVMVTVTILVMVIVIVATYLPNYNRSTYGSYVSVRARGMHDASTAIRM
jgi:ABC-type dipeptide/oligopeptide/nickel transport system permease subunit